MFVSTYFSYLTVHIMNVESHMQFTDLCVPGKVANSTENSVLQVLLFYEVG
jgi:hypothetical protein